MIIPGWTGMQELRSTSDETADLTIEVTGIRWMWQFYYKDHDVWLRNPKENLVLPNESLIRFKVTAHDQDVLHSFWIPAFRQKIDAVPGLITTIDVTTNRIGSFAKDPDYRVQCAELCGVGHSVMSQPVQVVGKSEFADWITTKRE
jgi:cytochrome c oxidase subunit 2